MADLNIKTRIHNIIDKEVYRCFEVGYSLITIIQELEKKSDNIMKIIDRDKINIEPIYPVLFGGADINDLPNVSVKLKYYYTYLTYCKKRIEDIKWIILNKKNFPHHSNSQVYKLLSLREKLSVENSFPF
jgi:hypothetical protein